MAKPLSEPECRHPDKEEVRGSSPRTPTSQRPRSALHGSVHRLAQLRPGQDATRGAGNCHPATACQIPKLMRRAYYAHIPHELRHLWPGGAQSMSWVDELEEQLSTLCLRRRRLP